MIYYDIFVDRYRKRMQLMKFLFRRLFFNLYAKTIKLLSEYIARISLSFLSTRGSFQEGIQGITV